MAVRNADVVLLKAAKDKLSDILAAELKVKPWSIALFQIISTVSCHVFIAKPTELTQIRQWCNTLAADLQTSISTDDASPIFGPRDATYVKEFNEFRKKHSVSIFAESEELQGVRRVAIDGVLNDEQCQQLMALAEVKTVAFEYLIYLLFALSHILLVIIPEVIVF